MLKRLGIELLIILSVTAFFIGIQLLSNYNYYGTFLLK